MSSPAPAEPRRARFTVRRQLATPWAATASVTGFVDSGGQQRPPRTTRPFPLVLAASARRALHVHAWRDSARVVVLLGADALVLVAVRLLALWAVSSATVRAAVATAVSVLGGIDSRGMLAHAEWLAATGDMRAVAAVLVGLALARTYGAGDRRRAGPLVFGGAVTGVLLNEWNNCWEVPSALPIAVVAALLVGGAVAAGRVGVDWMVQRTRRLWDTPRRTLVVGMPEAVRDVLNVPALAIQRAFSVVGGIDAVGALADPRADGMLGGIHDMHRVIDRHEVETVIIAGAMPAGEFRHVVQLAERAGCSVFALPGTASLDGFSPELEWHGGDAFIRLSRPGMQGRHLLLKRLVDVVGGTLGLVLLSPLLLVVALAVRCSSPGPVLFRQLRVGRGGRLFRIYKFRSMVADAEARKAALARESLYASGHLFKMPNDPRVTRVGAFLRKTSIDELPQLWNVVAGHMSLVGPRPPLPSEVAEYDDHHFVRFCMRPGLTGPWQVSGRNGVTDFERVVQLEHEYMRAWSIRKDLLILLRTIPAVLQQRGAH